MVCNNTTWNYSFIPAPDPNDLLWENIHYTNTQSFLRQSLSWIMCTLIIIFYSIPSTFIVSLMSLKQLSREFKFLRVIIESSSFVKGILQGFLPVMLLLMFITVLPYLFLGLGYLEGHTSRSNLERSAVKKMFFFLFVNIFLTTAVASNIFRTGIFIIKDPGSLAEVLGRSIPSVGDIFINVILTRTCISLPSELLRLGSLAWVESGFVVSYTPRQKDEARTPCPPYFCEMVPYMLLMTSICFSYAVIEPVVILFGLAHFNLCVFVYSHQFLYVYQSTYDSHGKLFTVLIDSTLAALMFSQVALIGIFAIKEAHMLSYFLFPLPILTFLAHLWLRRRFQGLTENLDRAGSFEATDRIENNPKRDTSVPDIDAYLPPCLQTGNEYPQLETRLKSSQMISETDLNTMANSNHLNRRSSLFAHIMNR